MGRRLEFAFPATMDGFRGAFGTLLAALDGQSLAPGARYGVELVFEEIVANILRHGAGDDAPAPPAVAVAVELGDDAIVMTFDDDGPPFDPCGREDPPLPGTLADADPGGLGLMMVRRTAKDMVYRRLPERRNQLIVTIAAPTPPTN